MIGEVELYEETIHPNFQEKRDKAQQILDTHGKTIASFNRNDLAKTLMAEAKVKIKESDKLNSNYKHGKVSLDVNEFCQ